MTTSLHDSRQWTLALALAKYVEPLNDRTARALADYIAFTGFCLTASRIAAARGVHRSLVMHNIADMETRRDDRGFDAMLCEMERVMLHLRGIRPPGTPESRSGV